jgi:hypothetical protein
MDRVNVLVGKIEGFTSGDKAKPEDVKTLANQVKGYLCTNCVAWCRATSFDNIRII